MSSEVINLDSINRQSYNETSAYDLSQVPNGKAKRILRLVCTKVCAGIIILGIISIVVMCIVFIVCYENDGDVTLTVNTLKKDLSPEQDFWFDKALQDLQRAFNAPINTKKAQNVIVFVADGFNPDVINSARVRRYGVDRAFSWEHFPYVGVVRWNNTLADGTAMFGGVGAHSGTAGVDASVQTNDCPGVNDEHTHVESLISWAQQSDLKTGIVTNGDYRRGMPIALYAHIANDSWACPTMLPDQTENPGCMDAETQLRLGSLGKEINVLMGWNSFGETCGSDHTLKETWRKSNYFIAEEAADFSSKSNEPPEYFRALLAESLRGSVALQTMLSTSLQILTSDSDGFLLVVICRSTEKGTSDGVDILQLDEAVKVAIHFLGEAVDETLILTTFTPFHSGQDISSDTLVHATGPMAHLFRNIHDPTFIAHVISYAARIGRFRDRLLFSSLLQWF
ncbi:alkaline phosphatase, tissue-nonspecific isozyme-like [Armigeres subalbatus]|uniref:alkaline phosphatase, tissue-nonspecific isozyme-like n=1 Tax=Armigeres subalbatus TaxID=124917 RepID=UPI002ED2058E